MDKHEALLADLKEVLEKHQASLLLESSEWLSVKLNVRGDTVKMQKVLDMGTHKVNSRFLTKHFGETK